MRGESYLQQAPPESTKRTGRARRTEQSPQMRGTRNQERPRFLRTQEGKKEQPPDVVRLVTEEENVDTDVLYEQLTRDFVAAFSQDARGIRGIHLAGTKFQNRLLRVLYQKIPGFNFRELQGYILQAIKNHSEPTVQSLLEKVPEALSTYRKGVEETLRYIHERENSFSKESNKGKELVIGTNDGLDAMHKIDVVEAIVVGDMIEEVRFIQIKSGRFDKSEQNTVHKAHEEYVGLLRSSETQERMERTAKGPEDLKNFTEQVSSAESSGQRFDLYGERYNDLLLECLLVCQKDAGQSPIDNKQVDGWLKKIHPTATDEERMLRMTEFGLMLRAPKSQELFRMFAMATGEEHIEEVVQRFHKSIRSWALSFDPPLEALRAVTGDYKPDARWLMRDSVKFTSVYKCQDAISEQPVIA